MYKIGTGIQYILWLYLVIISVMLIKVFILKYFTKPNSLCK